MFFSKKYSTEEVATGIALYCMDPNQLDQSVQLCIQEGEMSALAVQAATLKAELIALRIFICDLAIYVRYGTSPYRREITDEFCRRTIDTYPDTLKTQIERKIQTYGTATQRVGLNNAGIIVGDLFAKELKQDENASLKLFIAMVLFPSTMTGAIKVLDNLKLKS